MEYFQSYDWKIDESKNSVEYDELRAWCLNRESIPCLVRISGIPSCCYLEFPEGFLNTRKNVNDIIFSLKSCIAPKLANGKKDFEAAKYILLKVEVQRDITFLYESRKGDVVYIEVINVAALRRIQKISSMGGMFIGNNNTKIEYKVWEADIPMHVKLLAQSKLAFCQWFTGENELVHEDDKISYLKNEYWMDANSIKPIPLEESTSWVTHPGVLSFDIECFSSNPKRLPVKESASDVITMISCLYFRDGKIDSTLERYIIVNGECNDIEGSTVIVCRNEVDLLKEFLELIKKLDPEILLGFNTQGFDIPYIDQRLERRFISWGDTSRVKGQIPFVKCQTTFSEAYGHQTMYLIKNMEGRIHFDLMNIVKRNEKLRKYSLDFVSKHYLGYGKHDVSPQEMFAIYARYKNAKTEKELKQSIEETTRVAKYCIQDSELVLKLFQKMTVWIGSLEMCNVVHCIPSDLYTRGQQIKCNAQVYTAAYHSGYIVDYVGTAFDYKGAYVKEPSPGLYSPVCGLDFASLYPSIIQAYNICYTTFTSPSDKYTDEQCHIFDFDEEFEMKVDKESEEAKKYITDKEQEHEDDSDDEEDEELQNDLQNSRKKKITIHKKVHYNFRFLKKEVKEGLVPMIVRKLVTERKAVRKQMEKYSKTDLTYIILDKRQWALKISANSIYGFLGVKNGIRPFIQGAIAVTYMGRVSINKVNDYLISKGLKVVYNDTDSAYVNVDVQNIKDVYEVGEQLSKEVSALFPPPMKLEFEKPFKMLAIKRKKYAYVIIDTNGELARDKDGEIKIDTKGIITARRDNCKWNTDTYYKVLMNVMTGVPVIETADVIFSSIEELFYDHVNPYDLAVNKSLGANYKSETATMKVFGDLLKEEGHPVEAGERLDYVIVDTGNKKDKQGKKMRLVEMFIDNEKDEKIDKMYYLKNVLRNNIDQLYSIGYQSVWKKIPSNVGIKVGARSFRPLNEICSFIIDSLEGGMKNLKQTRQTYMGLLNKYI